MPAKQDLLFTVANEFGKSKRKSERAGGKAAHRDHQGEPAGVGMRALVSNAAEQSLCQGGGYGAGEKDGRAGS